MGGDNSPNKTVEGVKIFLDKYNRKDDFILNLFGDEKKSKKKLKRIILTRIL